MTTTNHQEESLKALRRKEIERLWFDQEATDEELLEVYKSLDVKKEIESLKALRREEKFKDNLELLDFPEENSIGWRLAEEMTEEDL